MALVERDGDKQSIEESLVRRAVCRGLGVLLIKWAKIKIRKRAKSWLSKHNQAEQNSWIVATISFVEGQGIELALTDKIAPVLGMRCGGRIAISPGQSEAEESPLLSVNSHTRCSTKPNGAALPR